MDDASHGATGGGARPLRDRRKLDSMREIQAVAIELFTTRGFEAVTVGDIAAAVAVSDSTVYRYFGTKERLVTWQDYEPELQAALLRRLAAQPPVDAIRDAYIEAVAPRYDQSQLSRIAFIYRTPQVYAATVEQSYTQHAYLTKALEGAADVDELTAGVIAGACLAAVDVAIGRWQESGGNTELAALLADAFDALAHAAPTGPPQ
ncbi:MAG: TetR family transcriptional regulator [Actinomycetota bacterium]